MNVGRYVRAGGAVAHLLLAVVLALGVFVMHTVGHPADDSGSGSGSHSGMSSSGHPHAAAMHAVAGADAHALDTAEASPTDEPAGAMDMASLCLAVLGAWALAALLYAAFTRRRDWLADLLKKAVVALRPNPPPRIPDLAELSVLRI